MRYLSFQGWQRPPGAELGRGEGINNYREAPGTYGSRGATVFGLCAYLIYQKNSVAIFLASAEMSRYASVEYVKAIRS